MALGQKIEAVERIVSVWRSLVGRCAAIGMTLQRVADLPFLFLAVARITLAKQAQLKVGAFMVLPWSGRTRRAIRPVGTDIFVLPFDSQLGL
jgi:hypothetical protein